MQRQVCAVGMKTCPQYEGGLCGFEGICMFQRPAPAPCIDPDCGQTTGHAKDCALDMRFPVRESAVEVK